MFQVKSKHSHSKINKPRQGWASSFQKIARSEDDDLKIKKLRTLRGRLHMEDNWGNLRSLDERFINAVSEGLCDIKKGKAFGFAKVKKKFSQKRIR